MLVSIGICVAVVGCLGCDICETAYRLPVADDAFGVSDKATRTVVFQEVVQTPPEGGSMLPEAVRGLWGNGEPEPQPRIQGADTMKWANETYEALKAKGLTTATDASSWLTQDFKNMNAWEYKVVQIDVTGSSAAERTLNLLGEQRWECFHVHSSQRSQMFFFKKQKRSYLKSLPTSDLMRLIPIMGRE